MSTVVLIGSHEIQQIWQGKVSPSSRFDETNARLRRIAKIFKHRTPLFIPVLDNILPSIANQPSSIIT